MDEDGALNTLRHYFDHQVGDVLMAMQVLEAAVKELKRLREIHYDASDVAAMQAHGGGFGGSD